MKVVIITSGGLDSAVLLKYHLNAGDLVRTAGINYGQRHSRELLFAYEYSIGLGVPHESVDVSKLRSFLPGSSQTSDGVPVPHGKYDEESMKATVVPNRNMILLSLAIGHAVAYKFEAVSYAAHAGDHAIYPDCREEFVHALGKAAILCDWNPVNILRPFIGKTKAEIVKLGSELGVDFSKTYSCYEGKAVHCGRCGTCVERILAFRESGVKDPTPYRDEKFALQFSST